MNERHALVVVDVGIAHGAAVKHQRVVEQVAVAIGRVLQLVEEVGQQADVIAIELGELRDFRRGFAVVRAGMERRLDAALGPDAAAHVAAHLEGGDAGGLGHEGQGLQIEHQLDVLFVGIGHAERRCGQRAGFAAGIVLFDALDAALDFAHVVEIGVEAVAVAGAEAFLQAR